MKAAPVPWLVAEEEKVVGFASAGPFRARPAYRWTAEASIYVAKAARRRGVARGLGEAILERLRVAGYRSAIGVVALPNPASEGLMKALGFRPVGVIHDAGFKLDRWWDVALWQRGLGS
jgi:phosphinothricin acetyltransferase